MYTKPEVALIYVEIEDSFAASSIHLQSSGQIHEQRE